MNNLFKPLFSLMTILISSNNLFAHGSDYESEVDVPMYISSGNVKSVRNSNQIRCIVYDNELVIKSEYNGVAKIHIYNHEFMTDYIICENKISPEFKWEFQSLDGALTIDIMIDGIHIEGSIDTFAH